MNIYFVRHGRSFPRGGLTYEEDGLVDLSPFGTCEARLLSGRVKQQSPEIFFSSPMVRATQTVAALNKGNVPVEIDARLAEFKPPTGFVGKHKLRALKLKAQQNREHVPGPGGESFKQCGARLISALTDIANCPYEQVFVVTHAFIMQCAFSELFDLQELPMFDTASVSLVTFKDGKFHLEFVNQKLSGRGVLFCKITSFPVRVLRGLKRRIFSKMT